LFRLFKDNVHFQNNVVELYSNVSCTAYVYGTSSLHHLVLNKVNAPVTLESNVTLTGDLTINSGALYARSYSLTAQNIYNSRIINKEFAGTIKAVLDFVWYNYSSSPILTNCTLSFGRNLVFNSGSNANLSGALLTYEGTGNGSIMSNSSTAQLGALTLSGASGGGGDLQLSLLTDSTEPLIVNGTITINNGNQFNLNGESLNAGGDITLYGNGKLMMGAGSILRLADAKALTVNSGSTLEVMGLPQNPVTITHQSGYYGLNIESGGTLKGYFTVFEYMNADGVNIKDGAFVDNTYSLHYCTFQNGISGGTLLTINTDQSFYVSTAAFPENTWGGASNVRKTINQGSVTMYDATGDFAGELNDDDSFNLISWMSIQPDLLIENFESNPTGSVYVGEPVEFIFWVRNDSGVFLEEVPVAIYYDLPDAPDENTPVSEIVFIPELNPGAWHFMSFHCSSLVSGIWQTWVCVDPFNAISETFENNNTAGYIETTWLAIPPVTDLTIAYNDLTGDVELAWAWSGVNYPDINGFNIYRSQDPSGPFDYLTGSVIPTARAYSEPASGTKYFYQIRAENTWP
jgi:hypothetical protein